MNIGEPSYLTPYVKIYSVFALEQETGLSSSEQNIPYLLA
jgi:antirestriction protein ArdC